MLICLLELMVSLGNASQPLLSEEKCSSTRRVVKPKPIALPVDGQPLRERKCSYATLRYFCLSLVL